MTAPLPPGQYESSAFPRFGLTPFAKRFPKHTADVAVEIGGDVERPIVIGPELAQLARVDRTADFHCVTTWSHRGLRWSGVRFADVYEHVIARHARPAPDASFVVLRGQDGARTSLPLCDLLADSVLLADRLNGEPLTVEHGAPLRLVAPAHYGYKSAKHLSRIEFWRDASHFRPVGFAFMDHPRARVEFEERGRVVPGWLLRYLYRPLVRPTVYRFRRELERHLNGGQ
jgi:DMSO/TMAO reductase YedYZ molybdopterin-dependent catalytic subunit